MNGPHRKSGYGRRVVRERDRKTRKQWKWKRVGEEKRKKRGKEECWMWS